MSFHGAFSTGTQPFWCHFNQPTSTATNAGDSRSRGPAMFSFPHTPVTAAAEFIPIFLGARGNGRSSAHCGNRGGNGAPHNPQSNGHFQQHEQVPPFCHVPQSVIDDGLSLATGLLDELFKGKGQGQARTGPCCGQGQCSSQRKAEASRKTDCKCSSAGGKGCRKEGSGKKSATEGKNKTKEEKPKPSPRGESKTSTIHGEPQPHASNHQQEDRPMWVHSLRGLGVFAPNEVSVKVKDGKVVVRGRREKAQGPGPCISRFEALQSIPLPETVEVESLKCVMKADGTLLLCGQCRQPDAVQSKPQVHAESQEKTRIEKQADQSEKQGSLQDHIVEKKEKSRQDHIEEKKVKFGLQDYIVEKTLEDGAEKKEALEDHTKKKEALKDHTEKKEALKDHTEKKEALEDHTERKEALKDHTEKKEALEDHTEKKEALEDHTEKKEALKDHTEKKEALEDHTEKKETLEDHTEKKEALEDHSEKITSLQECIVKESPDDSTDMKEDQTEKTSLDDYIEEIFKEMEEVVQGPIVQMPDDDLSAEEGNDVEKSPISQSSAYSDFEVITELFGGSVEGAHNHEAGIMEERRKEEEGEDDAAVENEVERILSQAGENPQDCDATPPIKRRDDAEEPMNPGTNTPADPDSASTEEDGGRSNHHCLHYPSTQQRGPFRVALPVMGFGPQDMHVKLRERTLTVQAHRQGLLSDAPFTEGLERQLELPAHLDTNTVRCQFQDGYLVITAMPKEEEDMRQVPVEVEHE